jgi:tryptophanyl-tRNA synthetase
VFKPALADLAVSVLSPISTEMSRLMQDPAEIDRLLGRGRTGRRHCPPDPGSRFDIVGMVRSRRG